MSHTIMSIPPGVRTERLRILRGVFGAIREHYRKRQPEAENVVWFGGQSEALACLDRHWEFCVQNVKDVHSWITQDVNGEIDWHKIVAMTQCNILKVLPLTFDDNNTSRDGDYKLNADYAFLCSFETMVSWCERWHKIHLLKFDSQRFPYLFSNKEEEANFKQRQYDISVAMLPNKIPLSFSLLSEVSGVWSGIGDQILKNHDKNRKR